MKIGSSKRYIYRFETGNGLNGVLFLQLNALGDLFLALADPAYFVPGGGGSRQSAVFSSYILALRGKFASPPLMKVMHI